MSRRWGVALALAAMLAALLTANTIVVDSETAPASLTHPEGRILELSSVDVQVVDQPATDPAPNVAPIVLLHCYARSLHWWETLAPMLDHRHRVIRLDLVGHGGSEKPQRGYAIEEQAAVVAEAMSRLGAEGATVVGHSMGGQVAAAMAESASELVDRVAVIGTPSSPEASSLPFVARLTYLPVLGQAVWRTRIDALVRSGYDSAFAPGFDVEGAFADPDQVVADNEALTYTSYDEAAAAADRFVEQESLASRFSRLGVPLLAILGSQDQIVDTPRTAADYGAVPGATVRVLEGIGHSPNLEASGETAESLLRFAGADGQRLEGRRAPSERPRDRRRGNRGR